MKNRCLSMAWIDYRKAYDMVPHSSIVVMFEDGEGGWECGGVGDKEYERLEDSVDVKWRGVG